MLSRIVRKTVVFIVINLFVANLSAAESCSPQVGLLATAEGQIEIQRSSGSSWQTAVQNAVLCQGDTVRAGDLSRATIQLINQSILRVDQNSAIQLTNVAAEVEEKSIIALLKGAFQSFSRKPRKFEVNTPYLNGSIEGTEFVLVVGDGESKLTVLEGAVLASNDHGKVMVNSGQAATAKLGNAPVHSIVVNPRDAVQWAMYYPPLLAAFGGDAAVKKENLPSAIRESVELIKRGDVSKALTVLDSMPVDERSENFYSYRAALFLSAGQVDKAEKDLSQALGQNSNNSDALALQAIIAITENDNDQALDLANKACQAAPDSSTALIALSYAQQAKFDLESARASLQQAVQVEPENALAWARLAALHSAFGDLDKTLEAADTASTLAPDLSMTQTILGFAYLTQVDTSNAMIAFNKAIELAQADPLPRLGLGLAQIRKGDLDSGGGSIELAVNLAPNNSIYRSYLGKTYYEQKRDSELVDQEYTTAEKLDPKDPTPLFYSAIEKQTTNRPVEALHDMQKAIDLNDNRAVYRSKLLLDEDLASRSAAIGRVYTDLGFQKRALVEGWKSVNTDPSNHSAHRLLADTYAVLPRHEIARVSELLQSQLLQPINMTPVQPRLGESNLFLIGAGGPGSSSFNEFNPMFNSNGLTFQGSSLIGENDTYSGEGIVAGIYDHASFSLGYSHFETDGWRDNADQNDEIANAFVQFELTPDTSIQAEYRYRDSVSGDVTQFFHESDIFFGLRNSVETHTVRAGIRHDISPDSTLLGSFIYQNAKASFNDDEPPIPGLPLGSIEINVAEPDRDAYSGEFQHLYRSEHLNLTSGVGLFDVNGQVDTLITALPPIVAAPLVLVDATDSEDTLHLNVYSYAQIKLLDNLTTILGLSYENVSGDFSGDDIDPWNPKMGIIWEPFKGTTVRAAAFRTLKRTLVTDQTLEPTQVAGFNQFFDDDNRSQAWVYGGAIDQVFTKNLYGGLEYTYRDLKTPILNTTPAGLVEQKVNWQENYARAYLFWTLHDWLALRAEYQYEKLKHDENNVQGVLESDTHRIPLGISFFHPSGVSAKLTATYVNQDGRFGAAGGFTPIQSGNSSFWTFDGSLTYRLPKRHGFFSFGGRNLFDRKFNFFDSDPNNVSLQPGRMLFGQVTLQIP